MKLYQLTIEDASHLGGPMGTEYTTVESVKLFFTLKQARDYCERRWGKVEEIDWRGNFADVRTHIIGIKRVKVNK